LRNAAKEIEKNVEGWMMNVGWWMKGPMVRGTRW